MIITPHPRIAAQEQIQEVKREIAHHEKNINALQERIQHAPRAKRGRAICVSWTQQVSSRNAELDRAKTKLEKLQNKLLGIKRIDELFPAGQILVIIDSDQTLLGSRLKVSQTIKA